MAVDWMCLLVPTQTAKTQFESRTKWEESKRRWKFFSNAMYGTHPPSTQYLRLLCHQGQRDQYFQNWKKKVEWTFFLENSDLRRAKGRLKVMPRPLTSIHPILVIWRAYQISLGSIIIWDTVYPPQELPSCSIVEVLTLGRKWPLCYDMGWFDESSP